MSVTAILLLVLIGLVWLAAVCLGLWLAEKMRRHLEEPHPWGFPMVNSQPAIGWMHFNAVMVPSVTMSICAAAVMILDALDRIGK